jgi:endonuclease YncB( thermonuclease family)
MHRRTALPRFAFSLALAAIFGAVAFAAHPGRTLPADAPSTVTGRAAVIDGDTLEIGTRRIRLFGISAPARGQGCRDGQGRAFACGRMAADALAAKIGYRTLACDAREAERGDRIVAVCRMGLEDINGWLVRHGWAAADPERGADYARAETGARAEKLGIWAGGLALPGVRGRSLR